MSVEVNKFEVKKLLKKIIKSISDTVGDQYGFQQSARGDKAQNPLFASTTRPENSDVGLQGVEADGVGPYPVDLGKD